MENTSFEASDFTKEQLAVPWEDFSANGMSELPLTSFSASGHIRTNVLDLSNFLLAHMNQGALGDQRILEPETMSLMHKQHRYLSGHDFPPNNLKGVGLSWFLYEDGYQGHSGFVAGLMADILYTDREALPYGMAIMMTKSHSKTEVDWDWWHTYYVPFQEILFEEGKDLALAEGK
jgi:hypothetical protein